MVENASQPGRLIILRGWAASGKSRLIKRLLTGKEDFPIPLGQSPHVWWRRPRTERELGDWMEKLARGQNLLVHREIRPNTRSREDLEQQDGTSGLRQAIQTAREVNFALVVAEPDVIHLREGERQQNREPHRFNPDELAPTDLARVYEVVLDFMSEYPITKTIIVDSSRPELDYYELAEWPEVRRRVFGV